MAKIGLQLTGKQRGKKRLYLLWVGHPIRVEAEPTAYADKMRIRHDSPKSEHVAPQEIRDLPAYSRQG